MGTTHPPGAQDGRGIQPPRHLAPLLAVNENEQDRQTT